MSHASASFRTTSSFTMSTSSGRSSAPTGSTTARSGPSPVQYVIRPPPVLEPTFRWSWLRSARPWSLRRGTPRSAAHGADAELVALGVGEDDPALAPLVDGAGELGGTEADEAVGFGLDVGGVDVEVHAVLHGLGLVDALEDQLVLGPVSRAEHDVLPRRGDFLVAESTGPERGERSRVLAVEDSDQLHRKNTSATPWNRSGSTVLSSPTASAIGQRTM